MGVIYKATCLITNRSYIGQTRNSLEERKKQHQKCHDGSPFHLAIEKYGKENFIWEILEECDNSKLDEREIFWIDYYHTYGRGYNATKGGDNANALDNWRKNNPEKFYDIALKNLEKANLYNKQHREEHMANLEKAREIGIEKVKKKVFNIDLNITFNSLADAERWSLSEDNPNGKKASHQHISKVCKGKRKTAGGYKWRYI